MNTKSSIFPWLKQSCPLNCCTGYCSVRLTHRAVISHNSLAPCPTKHKLPWSLELSHGNITVTNTANNRSNPYSCSPFLTAKDIIASISPLFILSRTLHIFKLLYVSYMTQGKVSLSPNPCINFDRPKPAAHVFFLDDWYGSEVTSFGLSGKSQSMLVDGLVSHSMWLSLSFLQEVSNKLHSHEYQWQPYCHH